MPFSKKGDASIGSVQNLTSELERVIGLVKDKEPPAEPPVRGAACQRIPVLGTMSEQRRTLDNEGYTAEALRIKAAASRAAEGSKKRARKEQQHDRFALEQPDEVPAVDGSLEGKLIEVLTMLSTPKLDNEGNEVLDDDGNEVLEDLKQWLPAEVKKVATGGASWG